MLACLDKQSCRRSALWASMQLLKSDPVTMQVWPLSVSDLQVWTPDAEDHRELCHPLAGDRRLT
jgi:hypothetical protein